jgi:hypothetical protein
LDPVKWNLTPGSTPPGNLTNNNGTASPTAKGAGDRTPILIGIIIIIVLIITIIILFLVIIKPRIYKTNYPMEIEKNKPEAKKR